MFAQQFDRIIICIPEEGMRYDQNFTDELKEFVPHLEINFGLPNENSLKLSLDRTSKKLLILEDLILEASKLESFLKTVIYTSHHGNISLIMTIQNYFFQAKNSVSLVRNFTEKAIFFVSDIHYLRNLSLKIFFNRDPDFLLKVFEKMEDLLEPEDMRYVLIVDSQASHLPYRLCVRTRIFPQKDGKVRPIFFLPPVVQKSD